MTGPPPTECPSVADIALFARGDLGAELRSQIEAHLEGCGACRARVVASADTLAATLTRSEPVSELAAGVQVGRYVITGKLGAGGMGVVYGAYDPKLDRPIALKALLRKGETGLSSAGQALLVKEARAMARLSHANVVIVHDVITEDDRTLVAMELIEGESLQAWLEREPRDWQAIVRTYLEAGRGLAAAHERGIVHGDFKPDNVLVAKDGRIKVGDFGLARVLGHAPDGAEALPQVRDLGAILPERLSMGTAFSYAFAGTPAYMAPEQLRGARADAKSDQFSFCAALYQSLMGELPFAGRSVLELLDAAERGRVRPAPSSSDVPEWVRAILVRGLSAKPEDRASSVAELLTALGSPPAALPEKATPPTDVQRPQGSRASWSRAMVVGALALTGFVVAGAAGVLLAHGPSSLKAGGPRVGDEAGSRPIESEEDVTTLSAEPFPAEALAAYHAGIQLWMDASHDEARMSFKKAVDAAPAFAAAELFYVVTAPEIDAIYRKHYRAAVEHRHSLTARQASLLSAVSPIVDDVPDARRAAAQVAKLVEQSPRDLPLHLIEARLTFQIGDKPKTVSALQEILRAAHPPAAALALKAELAGQENNVTELRSSLRRCIDGSPSAIDCLSTLWQLESNEGHCAELEPLCKTDIARRPDETDGYVCLVDALYARHASWDAIQTANEARIRHLRGGALAPAPLAFSEFQLVIAKGDLDHAAELAVAWKRLALAAPDFYDRTEFFVQTTRLFAELGRTGEARASAREFANISELAPETGSWVSGALSAYLQSVAGEMGVPERDLFRQRFFAPGGRGENESTFDRWYYGDLLTAWTHDEAVRATGSMPTNPKSPVDRDAEDDFLYGNLYSLAGQSEKAAPFFARAASSCGIGAAFYRVRAQLALAELSEGDPNQACWLYGRVIAAWGASKGSVTAAAALRRASKLGCGLKSPPR